MSVRTALRAPGRRGFLAASAAAMMAGAWARSDAQVASRLSKSSWKGRNRNFGTSMTEKQVLWEAPSMRAWAFVTRNVLSPT
jgi:hypothetical protein